MSTNAVLDPNEQLHTPVAVAARLGLHITTVRREFRYWPGVVWFGSGGSGGRRARRILRIPESAVQSFIRERMVTLNGQPPIKHRQVRRSA